MRHEGRLYISAQQEYGQGKLRAILSLSGRTDGEPVATGKVLASEAGKNILEGGFLDETTVGCTADPFPAAWLRRR